MKKWLLSWLITPTRVRKIVAGVVSWLIYRAIVRGTWDVVLEVGRWMRRLGSCIESWDAADLQADKDKIIADLVSEAITDEAVDKLLERVAAMRAARLAKAADAANYVPPRNIEEELFSVGVASAAADGTTTARS